MTSTDNISTAREEAILNSVNEGVFSVDREWRITTFNKAAERITGVPREEALGQRCCEVFRADICERNCALRRTLENGEPVVNATARIINRQGEAVPIRLSTALLESGTGEQLGGVETFQDLTQVEQLRKKLQARYTFEDIVGRSPSMTRLFELLPPVAESRSTVLIEGPSGTGKELFARAIHHLSPRRKKPFIAVNCAALPDTLLESELFGYVAGAFTDAKKDKPGRFALADGGTLFLDEIGDISPALQTRLLRVLQERVIEPLGSVKSIPVDVRVIAATNKNLEEEMQAGRFRNDLYYRIRVVHLALPPLKGRREDIPLLVSHLIARFNALQDKYVTGVAPEVLARLMDYDFPGNIRELENIIEQAFVLSREGLIEFHHLPPALRPPPGGPATTGSRLDLETLEKAAILDALQRNNDNRRKAAAELGIHISTLFRKLAKYQI